MPAQLSEWSQPQFQGHRRSPSEYSDVSSVTHSPNLVSTDSFDADLSGHSPLQRPSDGSLYQEVLGIKNFSISEHQIHGHSPSHSPAISPRLMPQQLADPMAMLNQNTNHMYGMPEYSGMQTSTDAFPTLSHHMSGSDIPQMTPPAINIDLAPNTMPGGFDDKAMDQDSLTPPDRGTY